MNTRTVMSYIVFLILFKACAAAFAENSILTVGRGFVTDVVGEVFVGHRQLRPLSMCYDGDEIEVAPEGRLTLVMTQPLYEYVISGPARFRLSGAGLKMISGDVPQKRNLFPGRAMQLQEGLIEQASTRTRNGMLKKEVFSKLRPNATLTGVAPEFHWETFKPVTTVTFSLFDAQANPLYSLASAESGFRLPETVKLQARQHYTWVVSGRLKDGRLVRSQGNFIVADRAQLSWRSQLGDCNTSTSKQIACVFLLEQAGFRGDADQYWDELAKSVPDHSLIRAHRNIVD